MKAADAQWDYAPQPMPIDTADRVDPILAWGLHQFGDSPGWHVVTWDGDEGWMCDLGPFFPTHWIPLPPELK